MARSEDTRKVLAASLKKLMGEYPFDKIPVGMIADGAGLTRKSFYYHFANKAELVNWILDTEFQEYLETTPEEEEGWEVMEMLFGYLYKEKDFCRAILGIPGNEYIGRIMEPLLMKCLLDIFDEISDRDGYISFALDSFLAAIYRWLAEDEPERPEVFIRKLRARIIRLSERCLITLRQS